MLKVQQVSKILRPSHSKFSQPRTVNTPATHQRGGQHVGPLRLPKANRDRRWTTCALQAGSRSTACKVRLDLRRPCFMYAFFIACLGLALCAKQKIQFSSVKTSLGIILFFDHYYSKFSQECKTSSNNLARLLGACRHSAMIRLDYQGRVGSVAELWHGRVLRWALAL